MPGDSLLPAFFCLHVLFFHIHQFVRFIEQFFDALTAVLVKDVSAGNFQRPRAVCVLCKDMLFQPAQAFRHYVLGGIVQKHDKFVSPDTVTISDSIICFQDAISRIADQAGRLPDARRYR